MHDNGSRQTACLGVCPAKPERQYEEASEAVWIDRADVHRSKDQARKHNGLPRRAAAEEPSPSERLLQEAPIQDLLNHSGKHYDRGRNCNPHAR